MPEPIQIEQTSKQFKAVQAAGVVLMLVGLLALVFGAYVLAGVTLIFGLAAYVYARVGAWWRHG